MDENASTTEENNQATDSTSTEQQTGQDANNLDSSASTNETGSENATDTTVDTPAKFDNDIEDWIEKRGLPAASDDAQKQKYQDLRNEQREFTRTQQAKKDVDVLSETITAAKPEDSEDETFTDPLEKRQNALEAKYDQERTIRLQSEFYTANKVTPEENEQILALFKEKIERPISKEGKIEAFKLWSKPESLQELYDQARAKIILATGTDGVADKAAREERARIAKESQANSPGRNAKVTSTSDKTADQERTERLKARYSS